MGIARPVGTHQPALMLFLAIFVVCMTMMALLNLVTALFVEATMEEAKKDNRMHGTREKAQKRRLIQELMEVFEESDTDASGAITYKEWEAMTSIPGIAEKFRRLGF